MILDTIVILAGGMATRLMPLTKDIPKSLIQINAREFILYQIDLLKKNGIKNVVLCVGNHGQMIEEFLEGIGDIGLNIKFSYDGRTPLGTGGAIKKALKLVGDEFFVIYGDSYLETNYQACYKKYRENINKYKNLMVIYKNKNELIPSNVEIRANKIIEYNKDKLNPRMEYIDWGLGILARRSFDLFKGEVSFGLDKVYEKLVKRDELAFFEVNNRFYEIGSFKGIEEFEHLVSNGQ